MGSFLSAAQSIVTEIQNSAAHLDITGLIRILLHSDRDCPRGSDSSDGDRDRYIARSDAAWYGRVNLKYTGGQKGRRAGVLDVGRLITKLHADGRLAREPRSI